MNIQTFPWHPKGRCSTCAHYRLDGGISRCHQSRPYVTTSPDGTCDAWRSARESVMSRAKQAEVKNVVTMKSWRHGSYPRYMAGCRCEQCSAVGVNPNKKIVAKYVRLQAMLQDPLDCLHGTQTGYNYGCKCPRCCEAYHVRLMKQLHR